MSPEIVNDEVSEKILLKNSIQFKGSNGDACMQIVLDWMKELLPSVLDLRHGFKNTDSSKGNKEKCFDWDNVVTDVTDCI